MAYLRNQLVYFRLQDLWSHLSIKHRSIKRSTIYQLSTSTNLCYNRTLNSDWKFILLHDSPTYDTSYIKPYDICNIKLTAATSWVKKTPINSFRAYRRCMSVFNMVIPNIMLAYMIKAYTQINLFHFSLQLILYLVKELPLGVWKPLDSDLTILEDWLACPIISIRNNVARYLITHLNWGFVSAEGYVSHTNHNYKNTNNWLCFYK